MARRMALGMRGTTRRFFGNFGLKVLALLVAVALWFLVTSGRETTCDLQIPFEVVGVPEGFVVNGALPPNVSVRVAGRGLDLYRIRATDFKVTVNLAGKEPGIHRVDLSPSNVVYAGKKRIRVAEIVSEKILMLQLEQRVTKTVPVKVVFAGKLAPGFFLGLPTVEPPRATLYGSAKVLEKITAVSVVADVEGQNEAFTVRSVIRPPSGITLVGAAEATVTVAVGPPARKVFSGVEVVPRGGGYVAVPSEVNVTLEGERSRLDGLTRLRAFTDVEGTDAGRVQVELPDQTTLIALTPLRVQLEPRGKP